MIYPETLMKGNLFKDPYSEEVFEVDGFDKERIWYGNLYSCPFELARPIAVTPEVLQACTFTFITPSFDDKGQPAEEIIGSDLEVGINETQGFCFFKRDGGVEVLFSHLHELQNHYFLNYGVPLEIDLSKKP